jgi:hypothetical protein
MNGLNLGGYASNLPMEHVAGDVRLEASAPAARSRGWARGGLVLAVPLALSIVLALTATGVGVLNAANEHPDRQPTQVTDAENPRDAGVKADTEAGEGAETSATMTGSPSPGFQPRAERGRASARAEGRDGKEKHGRGKGHGRGKHKD